MARKLGWLVMVVVAIALPSAAGELGTISGSVRNSSGVPQMGAMVEVYGPAATIRTVFTDPRGSYRASGLIAGVYQVKVSAPSFLPSLREHVAVRSGASLVVNLTLNTLFEAMQLAPASRRTAEDDEDWKWTLRSMANRPVLRMVDDGPLVVVSRSDRASDKVLKARVAFLAGGEGDAFGGPPDMRTAFQIERSLFTSGTISLDGNVGYSPTAAMPSGVLRATYSRRMSDGSEPEVSFTARRFMLPTLPSHDVALQALAFSASHAFSVANFIDLRVGSQLESIQFIGHAAAVAPFGSLDVHLSPDTVVEYRYSSSVPNMRMAKGFDSAPADLSESGPRVSLSNWRPVLEHARHQEVSVSRRHGRNRMQVAVYTDRISNPAVTGVGDTNLDSGFVLPDAYSQTFSVAGRDLNTNGLRVVYQRKLSADWTATVDYSYGGVLDLIGSNVDLANAEAYMRTERRHSVAYKMSGKLPLCKTRWLASYKWTSGDALTPVDLFNAGPGQSDPFLNVFLRQPIPGMGFMPGHMEALVDIRNLLAQGYEPVIGQDGHTVYLVQSTRALRGGVSFTF